jgi:hypothetical protein
MGWEALVGFYLIVESEEKLKLFQDLVEEFSEKIHKREMKRYNSKSSVIDDKLEGENEEKNLVEQIYDDGVKKGFQMDAWIAIPNLTVKTDKIEIKNVLKKCDYDDVIKIINYHKQNKNNDGKSAIIYTINKYAGYDDIQCIEHIINNYFDKNEIVYCTEIYDDIIKYQ